MGTSQDLTGARWRKSSYSGDTGGDCVECAPLGAAAWRKSSYSGDTGGECVEVAAQPCRHRRPRLQEPRRPRLHRHPRRLRGLRHGRRRGRSLTAASESAGGAEVHDSPLRSTGHLQLPPTTAGPLAR